VIITSRRGGTIKIQKTIHRAVHVVGTSTDPSQDRDKQTRFLAVETVDRYLDAEDLAIAALSSWTAPSCLVIHFSYQRISTAHSFRAWSLATFRGICWYLGPSVARSDFWIQQQVASASPPNHLGNWCMRGRASLFAPHVSTELYYARIPIWNSR